MKAVDLVAFVLAQVRVAHVQLHLVVKLGRLLIAVYPCDSSIAMEYVDRISKMCIGYVNS